MTEVQPSGFLLLSLNDKIYSTQSGKMLSSFYLIHLLDIFCPEVYLQNLYFCKVRFNADEYWRLLQCTYWICTYSHHVILPVQRHEILKNDKYFEISDIWPDIFWLYYSSYQPEEPRTSWPSWPCRCPRNQWHCCKLFSCGTLSTLQISHDLLTGNLFCFRGNEEQKARTVFL